MKERGYIGEGYEHHVVKADYEKPVVLKRPKPLTQLGVFLNGGASSLREEHNYTKKVLEGTGVLVPETRVFAFGAGYVIAQEYIEDDKSVSLSEYFDQHPSARLRKQYSANPDNFVASVNGIYRIDTTAGRISRFLMASRLLTREQVENLKDKVRSLKRSNQ